MKTPVYFPVSTTHYSTTLSINIRRTKGWQGYGQYLTILQMLANTKDRKLRIEDVPEIAFQLRITEEEVMNIINSYYVIEAGVFHSPELEEALSYFDTKYNAASAAGKKSAENLTPEQRKEKAENAAKARWNKTKNNANTVASDLPKVTLQDDANTLEAVSIDANKPQNNANNKIKENKIEEKRIEENISEQNLTEEKRMHETVTSDLGVNSVQYSCPSDTSKYLKNIQEDHLLKSKYFGETLNIKLLKNYLDSDIKSKLTFQQFDNLFLLLLHEQIKEAKGISQNREYLADFLIKCYQDIQPIIMQMMNVGNIQRYLDNEYQINESLKTYLLY
jgi:hypothetical protein